MYNTGNSSKNVTTTSIVDGTVSNADIDASAAIAQSKLATLAITDSEVADNALSGNKIDGGTISTFQSTGIDDSASTANNITITDSLTTLSGGLKCDAASGATATFKSANSKPYIVFEDSSGTAEFYIGDSESVGSGTGFYDFYTPSSLGYRFYTNTVERMRILADGGITFSGTISDFASTGIDDNATATTITINSDENVIVNNPAPSVDDKLLEIQNNGSSKFNFYEDGKLHLTDSEPELYIKKFYNLTTFSKASPDASDQVTITVELSDTTSKYGTVLVEVFLCGDTGSSSAKAYYQGTFPVAVRAGSSTSDVATVINESANGITLDSTSTSVTTLTIIFDSTYAVTGYVIGHGGMGYLTSATLTGA